MTYVKYLKKINSTIYINGIYSVTKNIQKKKCIGEICNCAKSQCLVHKG